MLGEHEQRPDAGQFTTALRQALGTTSSSDDPRRITSKSQMYDLLQKGALGNTLLIWDTAEEALAFKGYPGPYGLGEISSGGGKARYQYHISASDLPKTVEAWNRSGIPDSRIRVLQMAPHEDNLLQGHVTKQDGPLYMVCSSLPNLTLREAMEVTTKATKVWRDLLAQLELQRCLTPNSYVWLMYLLDEGYPGCIVEFSAFSCYVGIYPRENTVIWEVRHY